MIRIVWIVIFSLWLAACSSEDYCTSFIPLDENSVILALGNSLTYGVGASQTTNYPTMLEKLINHRVINAGVPGNTSAQALKRLPELLDEYHPTLVILLIGGNDFIKKIPKNVVKANIEKMITLIRNEGGSVILIATPGFSLTLKPPKLYQELSEQYKVPLIKKQLSTLISNREYKSDLTHLNAKGYKKLAEIVADFLKQCGLN